MDSTGNPITYSEVFCTVNPSHPIVPELEKRMVALWKRDLKVLWRTPDNAFGQNSHDEYGSLAHCCIRTGNKKLAREVLCAALTKLFYMKNVPLNLRGRKLLGKDGKLHTLAKPFLLLHLTVWLKLLAAAFPGSALTVLTRIALQGLTSLQKVDTMNASGMQLRFMDLSAIRMLGNPKPMEKFLWKVTMHEVMANPKDPYYDADHVTIQGYQDYMIDALT
jgi:hypothetical protein